ncbi:UNVERIFIED_CONTAM: hypothetical protein HDU68_000616 [Siphonaria sp. JEL0065]|nr:hypothetical protein HDU68_000616 [Siphonaria sp. JEL0065]
MAMVSFTNQINVRFFSDWFCSVVEAGSTLGVQDGGCLDLQLFSMVGAVPPLITTEAVVVRTSSLSAISLASVSTTVVHDGGGSGGVSGAVIGGVSSGVLVLLGVVGFFFYRCWALREDKDSDLDSDEEEDPNFDPNFFSEFAVRIEEGPAESTPMNAMNQQVRTTPPVVAAASTPPRIIEASTLERGARSTPQNPVTAATNESPTALIQDDRISQFDSIAAVIVAGQGSSRPTASFIGAIARARSTVRRMTMRRRTENSDVLIPSADPSNVAFWSIEDTAEWIYVNGGGVRGVANVHGEIGLIPVQSLITKCADTQIDGRVILASPVVKLSDAIGSDTLGERVRLQKALLILKDSMLPSYDEGFLTVVS